MLTYVTIEPSKFETTCKVIAAFTSYLFVSLTTMWICKGWNITNISAQIKRYLHFFCIGSIVFVSVIFAIITSHVNLMKNVNVKKSYIPNSIVAGNLRKPNSSILVLYWSKVFGDHIQITSPRNDTIFHFSRLSKIVLWDVNLRQIKVASVMCLP